MRRSLWLAVAAWVLLAPMAGAETTIALKFKIAGDTPPPLDAEYVPGDSAYAFFVDLGAVPDLYGYTVSLTLAGANPADYGTKYGFGPNSTASPIVDPTEVPAAGPHSYVFGTEGTGFSATTTDNQLTLTDFLGGANGVEVVEGTNDRIARIWIWTAPDFRGDLTVAFVTPAPDGTDFLDSSFNPITRTFAVDPAFTLHGPVAIIPEPASIFLFGGGLLVVAGLRWRRTRPVE